MTDEDVVPATEAALMTNNGMTGLELLIPHCDDVPPLALFLLACCTRAHTNEYFIADMLEWLEDFRAEGSKAIFN